MLKIFTRKGIRKLYYRVVRQEGTPESIARAMALGLFVGFFVPILFQTAVVLPLAFLLRANKVISFLFTCVTNPYTVILIYPIQCYVGSLMMFKPLDFAMTRRQMNLLIQNPSWEQFSSMGMELIIPFLLGGLLFAVVAAPIGYFCGLGMVHGYQRRKEARLRKRLAESAKRNSSVNELKLNHDSVRKLEN